MKRRAIQRGDDAAAPRPGARTEPGTIRFAALSMRPVAAYRRIARRATRPAEPRILPP